MAGEAFGNIPVLRPDRDLTKGSNLQPQADETTRKLYAASLPGIVKIETENSLGSGFFVDKDGHVVTDAHCVQGDDEVEVITQQGDHYRARVEKLDDINDLALLKLEGAKTPASSKPLDLGSSSGLKADQPIYAIGHPLGLDQIYISPGYFRHSETELQFIQDCGDKDVKEEQSARKSMTPNELKDADAALRRPLIHGRVHVEHGNSGGPLLDASGKVVGVADLINPEKDSMSYFTPVEKIKDLLDSKTSKFDFSYTHTAETWANNYLWQWQHAAPAAALETSLAGLAGYTAYAKLPRVTAVAVGAYGLHKLSNDYEHWRGSHNSGDSWKFGLATLSDVAMTAGAVARFIPATKSYAAIAMAAGVVGHLASDFIPSRLVMTDIRRHDGDLRPPHTLERIYGDDASLLLLNDKKLLN